MNGSDYSLYIHVPFCSRKCDYCHFYVVKDRDDLKTIYFDALYKEWKLRSPSLQKSPLSIYFGGGTPSLLAPQTIETILSWIVPNQDCEITLEVNPETITFEKIVAFKRAGINRISVGAQSFDNHLLNILSRTHDQERSQQTIHQIYQAGIQNISIDLMYDIPHQTIDSWISTLHTATELPISHISLYNLTFEPYTLFYKHKKSLQQHCADDATSLLMLETAINHLEHHGFKRYEISAFSKLFYQSKHNTGYWKGRPFLGFGPSAFSYWNGSRFRNCAHLHRYAKLLNEGKDPVDFSETLSPLEHLQEMLVIGLRMINGIKKMPFPFSLEEKILKLKTEGFLTETEDRLHLTSKGLLFHDTVAEIIIN